MKSAFREWSDIRVFLAVMREGSTLAAARVLGQAQPTVARRIDVLEHALGLELFVRSTKGFAPTDAARALVPQAEAMEAAARDLSDMARRQRGAALAPIRFSVAPSALTPNLTGILSEFREAHPEVSFDFVSTMAVVDLIKGEADMALRYARSIDDERLHRVQLGQVYCSFYASKSYVARRGLPKGPGDLDHHVFAVMRPVEGHAAADAWLAGQIRSEQIAAHCQDFESLMAAVQTGMGIGRVGRVAAARSGGLIHCFDAPDPVLGTVWLVTGPDARRRPEVRAFEAFFAPRYAAFLEKERLSLLPDEQSHNI